MKGTGTDSGSRQCVQGVWKKFIEQKLSGSWKGRSIVFFRMGKTGACLKIEMIPRRGSGWWKEKITNGEMAVKSWKERGIREHVKELDVDNRVVSPSNETGEKRERFRKGLWEKRREWY